jgi:radical SAM protein with 4Fe4S-binding SPASM domain
MINRLLKRYFKNSPYYFKNPHPLVGNYPLTVNYPFTIVNLELTNKCPMKCIMCPRTYKMTRVQGFMDFKVFKKIIDEIWDIDAPFIHKDGFWLHHFGESLLHPEFDKMIRYCSDKGVNVGLSVNPLVMGEKIARRLVESRPNRLFIALDGHDNESFYKIRGVPNAYEKSKENVLRYLEIKRELHINIKTSICMIDFPINESSINKVYDYWEDMDGVNDVHLKPFTDWNGKVKEISNLKKIDKVDKCQKPWFYMSIMWDGNVVPCCYDYDNLYVLGNVNNSSLKEIWNGDSMKRLRIEFKTNNIQNPLCVECRYK